MKHLFLLLFFISILIACNQEKVPVFAGRVIILDDINTVDSLTGREIILNDIYTEYMSVYDSLIFFTSSKYQHYFLQVFSLNTGKLIGSLCHKGNGTNEFYSFTHAEQFEEDSGEIKLYSFDLKNFYCLNVTRSIQSNETQIDMTKKIEWKKKHTRPLSFIFLLNNDIYLVKNEPESSYLQEKDFRLPSYYIYEQNIDNELKTFPLYHRMPYKDQGLFDADWIFYSLDRLKPDKSKVAMAMNLLCQINILDLKTNELKGFRLKNTPDFNMQIKENNHFKYGTIFYYTDLCVDDANIYALYSNTTYEGKMDLLSQSNEVHVFDWDGNLMRKIILSDGKFDDIALDPVNKLLYAKNILDEIFCYDVKKNNHPSTHFYSKSQIIY